MKKTDFITTIEARMTSSRLPGKVLKEINKMTSLEILFSRIYKSKYINKIIVATTINDEDSAIVEVAKKNNVDYYRGSEEDVLGRLSNSLKDSAEKYVIQLTGDNPIIDPTIIDYMVEYFIENEYDFITNNGLMNLNDHLIPLGMDVSIFKRKDLIDISSITKDNEDREHPTLYFYRTGKEKFKIKNVPIPKKWINKNNYRLTLDTEEDFYVISKICNFFFNNISSFSLEEIYSYLDNNPDIAQFNNMIKHKIPSGL
tara:strand:+ start:4657 stop:5427 length:771 start_codon:yes stop_codon:yes gene_type:complete